jgi:hypothetical protein
MNAEKAPYRPKSQVLILSKPKGEFSKAIPSTKKRKKTKEYYERLSKRKLTKYNIHSKQYLKAKNTFIQKYVSAGRLMVTSPIEIFEVRLTIITFFRQLQSFWM